MGRIFFLEKPVFFRAKNKTVIRRGPNPKVCLLVWAIVLSGIEKLMPLSKLKHSHMITLKSFISHYWIALKSNFGGKPASVHKNNSYQIAVFVCLLAGSIVWIFYRAFLTSELSIIKWKQPFNDLESFLASDYK